MGGGVESEDVPFGVLAPHDAATNVTVTGARRAGLDEEHRFDVRLHRVDLEAVEHRRRRVPQTRRAGAIIEGQQKAHRGLGLEPSFGLRSHLDRRGNAAGQPKRDGRCTEKIERVFHVLPCA